MMTILFDNIQRYLYQYITHVQDLNSRGLTDQARHAENLFAEILNHVFNWNLKNANRLNKNQKCFDLIDEQQNVYVQITSNRNYKKKLNDAKSSFCKEFGDGEAKYFMVFFIAHDVQKVLLTRKTEKGITYEAYDIKKLLDEIFSIGGDVQKLERINTILQKSLSPVIISGEPVGEKYHPLYRYLVTHNFDMIKEIFNGITDNLLIGKTLVRKTKPLTDWRGCLGLQEKREYQIVRRTNRKCDEYLSLYSDASIVEKETGDNNITYQRSAELSDIKQVNDVVLNYLYAQNVSLSKLLKVVSRCGRNTKDTVVEYLILRPFCFRFFVFENNFKWPIILNELLIYEQNGGVCKKNDIIQKNTISFSKCGISPNESVVIPLGAFLGDYGNSMHRGKSVDSKMQGNYCYFLNCFDTEESVELEYVGLNYFPVQIAVTICGEKRIFDLHDFDINQAYVINKDLMGGE